MRWLLALTLPLVLLFTTGCEQVDRWLAGAESGKQALAARPTQAVREFCFGYYTSDNVRAVYKKFTPVRQYLQEQLGHMGMQVSIQNKIYHSYSEANDALVKGECDFFRFGPASYVIAKERNPQVQLIAIEHKQGEKRSTGAIVVRNESRFKSLADLKGATFAFGDEFSTIGRYLAQAELVKAGIHVAELEDFEYLGRHDWVARAVLEGKFEAGAVNSGTLKKAGEGLRALVTFPNVSRPWVARSGLEPKVLAALKTALLGLKDPAVLEALEEDGFLETDDSDFQFVREGMKLAEQF
jgi:phosphonate transport system substrate-binding protein